MHIHWSIKLYSFFVKLLCFVERSPFTFCTLSDFVRRFSQSWPPGSNHSISQSLHRFYSLWRHHTLPLQKVICHMSRLQSMIFVWMFAIVHLMGLLWLSMFGLFLGLLHCSEAFRNSFRRSFCWKGGFDEIVTWHALKDLKAECARILGVWILRLEYQGDVQLESPTFGTISDEIIL